MSSDAANKISRAAPAKTTSVGPSKYCPRQSSAKISSCSVFRSYSNRCRWCRPPRPDRCRCRWTPNGDDFLKIVGWDVRRHAVHFCGGNRDQPNWKAQFSRDFNSPNIWNLDRLTTQGMLPTPSRLKRLQVVKPRLKITFQSHFEGAPSRVQTSNHFIGKQIHHFQTRFARGSHLDSFPARRIVRDK